MLKKPILNGLLIFFKKHARRAISWYNASMGKKQSGSFIIRVLQGLLIGAVCIIPGASGGVLAVSLGLYEPCVDAVYGFVRHFRTEGKRSFLFLLPLGLGGLMGLVACSFGLEWLLRHVREPFMYMLIGMVLGGLPSFFQEANQKGFKPRYLIATLVLLLIVGGAAMADRVSTGGTALAMNSFTAMLCGAIIVSGTMMPGMSTSFFLMMLGLYEPMLTALTHFDLPILFFAGVGGVIGGGLMLLLIRNLLKRYHAYTYYGMLGCLLATLVMIYPGFTAKSILWDALLLAAGFFGTWVLTKSSNKTSPVADMLAAGTETHTEEEL